MLSPADLDLRRTLRESLAFDAVGGDTWVAMSYSGTGLSAMRTAVSGSPITGYLAPDRSARMVIALPGQPAPARPWHFYATGDVLPPAGVELQSSADASIRCRLTGYADSAPYPTYLAERL